VVPDIVVLGKGMSGGLYPISATVMRQSLETVFHEDPFIHISTFGGSELGCLVAHRVLEISASPDFLKHVNRLAQDFAEQLENLLKSHSKFFIAVRQLGLMMGLVLRDDHCGPLLTKTAYDYDLLMIYANNDPRVCQLLPPLIMDPARLEWVIRQLDGALTAASRLKTLAGVKNGIGQFIKKIT
jgi:acetylornithine/succinyldiaminopimelate/putrescine aminotransferase